MIQVVEGGNVHDLLLPLMGTAHDFAANQSRAELNDTMHVMFHQEKLHWILLFGPRL